MKHAIGIDLGGTFVKFALVSENGDSLFYDKLPIKAGTKRDDIINVIHEAVRTSLKKAENESALVTGIGIGTPGVVNNGIVLGGADNLDGWQNVNLREIYSETYKLPVFVDNDANVMGLAEVAYGAAKDCSDVVFLTVGTGIGGAIVVGGKLYGGYVNRGGELGHIVVEHNGIDCSCGGKGCLEAYASTSALISKYKALTGLQVDGYHIVEKYHEGKTAAIAVMHEHAEYLGHGVASFINIFAPQKVVIGGGISEAGQFYIDLIAKAAFKYAMPDCSVNTQIVAAVLGNRAGCLGASSLVLTR